MTPVMIRRAVQVKFAIGGMPTGPLCLGRVSTVPTLRDHRGDSSMRG